MLAIRRRTRTTCHVHGERFGPSCTAGHHGGTDRSTVTTQDRAAWLDLMADAIDTAAAAGADLREPAARAREARRTAALYRATDDTDTLVHEL